MLRPAPLSAFGLALCATGCAVPSVAVQFDIPDAYRSDVASVQLRVLEPPPSAPFDCDAIAFRSVDDEVLRLSTTLQVALEDRDAEQSLVGIRRVGPKLFLAEGLDATGGLVVAGCSEVDAIDEQIEITVLGEPAAIASIGTVSAGAGEQFPAPPDAVSLRATDVHGAPLSARAQWLVVGPAGATERGAASTDATGAVELHPQPTALAGPALVEVSVRWSQHALAPLRFFQPPQRQRAWELPIAPAADAASILHVGRFGPSGEMAFAAAVTPPSAPLVFAVWYHGGPDDPLLVAPPATEPTPLVVVPGGDRDRLVGRGEASWYELDLSQGGGQWSSRPAADTHAEPLSALDAGACDGSSAMVLVRFAGDILRAYDPAHDFAPVEGVFTADPTLSAPFAGGCVEGTDDIAHRAVLFGPPACASCPDASILVADLDGRRTAEVGSEGAAAEFAPATGDSPPLLLQPYIDLDTIWLGRFRLAPADAGRLQLELVERDATALPAVAIAAADFDADGGLDLFAMLGGAADQESGKAYLLPFATLATRHRGDRVRVLGAGDAGSLPTLRARDFDGDGYDDLLVMTPTSLAIAFFGEAE